ncbi:MAG: hypothetical protein AMXMBFR84_17180 [Candidatus Hydrogenedentota bacterium]
MPPHHLPHANQPEGNAITGGCMPIGPQGRRGNDVWKSGNPGQSGRALFEKGPARLAAGRPLEA